MDNKRLFTTMLIVSAVMFGYMFFFNKSTPAPGPGPSSPLTAGTVASTQSNVSNQAPPQTLTLGDLAAKDGTKLKLVINNVGASLDLVQLNPKDYTEGVKDNQPYTLLQAEGNLRPFTTKTLTLNGVSTDIQTARWNVLPHTPNSNKNEARLELPINQEGKLTAKLTKIFRLEPDTYNVTISHEIENFTEQPLKIAIDQLGPTDLSYDSMQGDPRAYQAAGLNSAKKFIEPARKTVLHAEVAKTNSESLGNFQGDNHLVWVANYNNFFTVLVRPAIGTNTPASEPVKLVDGTISTPKFVGEATTIVLGERQIPKLSTPWKTTGIHLAGNPIEIAPKGKTQMPLSVYMGPKKRDLLLGDAHAPLNSDALNFHLFDYRGIIVFGQGMCAFCTFDPVVVSILWMLDMTQKYLTFGNWGAAIILLVIVVRLLLHPLTRYSQVNMAITQKKMAGIQPEIEKIKKKYAKDKSQQQAETMKLYKEKKVNPAGGIMGCLPMLLQMPIWLALYSGLRVDIDLRHASFLWISDLSNPDWLMKFNTSFSIPILGVMEAGQQSVFLLNLLPILLTFVFFFQMKMQAKTMPTPTDPQQAQTQKISQYMILLFPLFLYNAPSGLNLYIFASTIGGLFDTWLVRRHMLAKGILTPPAVK